MTLFVASCTKPDQNREQPAHYGDFLQQQTISFEGVLGNKAIQWQAGQTDANTFSGYQNSQSICDKNDPERMLIFGMGTSSAFRIYTPLYDAASEESLSAVFSPGRKSLGAMGSDFHLAILRNGEQLYSSVRYSNDVIEILQTASYTDENGQPRLRVWFTLSSTLLGCLCTPTESTLRDGRLVADFAGMQVGQ